MLALSGNVPAAHEGRSTVWRFSIGSVSCRAHSAVKAPLFILVALSANAAHFQLNEFLFDRYCSCFRLHLFSNCRSTSQLRLLWWSCWWWDCCSAATAPARPSLSASLRRWVFHVSFVVTSSHHYRFCLPTKFMYRPGSPVAERLAEKVGVFASNHGDCIAATFSPVLVLQLASMKPGIGRSLLM